VARGEEHIRPIAEEETGSYYALPFAGDSRGRKKSTWPVVGGRAFFGNTLRGSRAGSEARLKIHVLKDITDRREAGTRYRELF